MYQGACVGRARTGGRRPWEAPRGADSSAAGACRVFITAYLLLSRTAYARAERKNTCSRRSGYGARTSGRSPCPGLGGPETPRVADSSAAGACRVFITAYLLLSRTASANPRNNVLRSVRLVCQTKSLFCCSSRAPSVQAKEDSSAIHATARAATRRHVVAHQPPQAVECCVASESARSRRDCNAACDTRRAPC